MRISPPTTRAADAMRILAATPALQSLIDRGWLMVTAGGDYFIDPEKQALLSTGERQLLQILDLLGTLSLELAPLDMTSRVSVQVALDSLFSSVPLVPLRGGEILLDSKAVAS